MLKILAAFALLLTVLAGAAPAEEETIRIGVFECLTGQNALGGQQELLGIKLANKMLPKLLGRDVELIIEDNKSDREESARVVERLIKEDKVCAILGTYSSTLSMAAGEIAERERIPVVTSSSTNPLVTLGRDYYFRACFIDPFQGASAASYAYTRLGLRRAGILVDLDSDYSVGLATFFRNAFMKLGGEIVLDAKFHSGDKDFTSKIQALMEKKPEIVFMPVYYAEGSIILKQACELKAPFRLMGGDAMDYPDMVKLGLYAEGFLHTTFAYDPTMENMNPVAESFTKEWRETYHGREPNSVAALGYDAYLILADAILRAGSDDPQAIRDALERTENLPTVTGLTTINETHDAVKEMGMVEIINGKRVFLGIVKPDF